MVFVVNVKAVLLNMSEPHTSHGVPQGSVLGPMQCFRPKVAVKCRLLYVADSALLVCQKDVSETGNTQWWIIVCKLCVCKCILLIILLVYCYFVFIPSWATQKSKVCALQRTYKHTHDVVWCSLLAVTDWSNRSKQSFEVCYSVVL